jgi:gas vesicle protein
MENIIEKLQKEVGLSEDQAMKSLNVIKEYMDKENLHIDWEKFFKGKYENFKDSISTFFSKISDKAEDWSDKIGDKVEDLKTDTKQKIKDVSKNND